VLIAVVGIVPQHSGYVVAVAIRKFSKGRKPFHQKFYQLGGKDGRNTGSHTDILLARLGLNAGESTYTTHSRHGQGVLVGHKTKKVQLNQRLALNRRGFCLLRPSVIYKPHPTSNTAAPACGTPTTSTSVAFSSPMCRYTPSSKGIQPMDSAWIWDSSAQKSASMEGIN